MKEAQTADKPSTGATIPKSGFVGKLNSYIMRMVGEKNYFLFFLQGIVFILCKSMPTIFGSILRGKVYRIILGRCGGGILIERNVTLNIPRQIFLGNRIVLGESTVIDPRGPQGNIFVENDVHIQRWCRITTGGTASTPGQLTIKNSVYIGPYSYIHAAGNITIAKNCLFGPRVTIIAGKHNYMDKNTPIRLQGDIPQDIHIEEDVWVGANATILGGVTVGKGAIIAAGSIVTKDIPQYGIAMGVPAKVRGTRE